MTVDRAPADPAAASRPAATSASATLLSTPLHDGALAAALDDLGLALLRDLSAKGGQGQANAVTSPLSLAVSLGLLHAGTASAGADELARAVGGTASGTRLLTTRLPAQLARALDSSRAGSPLTMANRVWLDKSVVRAVPASYAAAVSQRYQADGIVLPLASDPRGARQTINAWVSQATARRIPDLLPEGAIKGNSRVVLTSAMHFKGRWSQAFDPAATSTQTFEAAPGRSVRVPTMSGERMVRAGTVDNLNVIELPFDGDYALIVAMPPAGHTLQALETELEGLDMASWSSQLRPLRCTVTLPRFSIAPTARSLKAALVGLGVRQVFSSAADLGPLLGKAGKGVQVDDVFQSAGITIDEQGGEAAAATGATVSAKSITLGAPSCAVNRAFVFSLVHKPTGLPLFVGKVSDPSKR
ncbi:serpin family protein [Sphaerotilus mobilis]|uniref:Serpin B n=1 Tax=Sphaerotilus mobilis TaxID=47994 RepID=A0A4Q7LS80_9BURK|nr:serpin family protein [Sphaerotilus mobilis]RZS57117.1 serpin B [Sphaerotilus mobilis]